MNDVKRKLLLMELKRKQEELENPKYIDMEKLKKEKEEYYKTHLDIKPDCLATGWVLYLIVMIGGLIFVDYVFLAIFSTIIFFSWRHVKIEEANGRRYND